MSKVSKKTKTKITAGRENIKEIKSDCPNFLKVMGKIVSDQSISIHDKNRSITINGYKRYTTPLINGEPKPRFSIIFVKDSSVITFYPILSYNVDYMS